MSRPVMRHKEMEEFAAKLAPEVQELIKTKCTDAGFTIEESMVVVYNMAITLGSAAEMLLNRAGITMDDPDAGPTKENK